MQRVSEASVSVDETVVATSGAGLVVLLGVAIGDESDSTEALARKIAHLRVFPDDEGRLHRSLVDIGGEALVVSQFTLVADTGKGNRPSFTQAAERPLAERLYEHFCDALEREGVPVARGVFGAQMQVSLVNDGPVTLVLER